MSEIDGFDLLRRFISKPVFQKATAPLKTGVEVAVQLDTPGSPWTLCRKENQTELLNSPATKPDMTFIIPLAGLESLEKLETEDVGEVGVALLQLLIHEDPARRMQAKVHIGPLDLFWKGYWGILPLGGPTVMKFLASKGMTNLSKIKEGIARFRD